MVGIVGRFHCSGDNMAPVCRYNSPMGRINLSLTLSLPIPLHSIAFHTSIYLAAKCGSGSSAFPPHVPPPFPRSILWRERRNTVCNPVFTNRHSVRLTVCVLWMIIKYLSGGKIGIIVGR